MTARRFIALAAALYAASSFSPGTSDADSAPLPEGRAIISTVDPRPPYCTLRTSDTKSDTILTITGENLTPSGDKELQFLDVETGEITRLGADGVHWRSPRRISVDAATARDRLPRGRRVVLKTRIAAGSYSDSISDWSDEFILADDRRACGFRNPFPPSSPIRGLKGDLWADAVIGKPSFSEATPNQVVPFKVFNPGGVVVDRSSAPGRAYIWDAGNSRILGIDLGACYAADSPCPADFVIGQPSGYDHSACNGDHGLQDYPARARASAATLCGVPDTSVSIVQERSFVTMAVGDGGDLYVPDSYNNRVLRFDSPFDNDKIADEVWGQLDFTGINCNRGKRPPTAETLCFHSPTNHYRTAWYGSGVEVGPEGSLWVADSGNHRVLRFPVDPSNGGIGKRSDLVLGQSTFTTASHGRGTNQMDSPSALRFGPQGRLYVADTGNNRVLVFEPPFESGMDATGAFGEELWNPTSLEMDPLGRGIWVNDSGNYMVELWTWDREKAPSVLGKSSHRPDGRCGDVLQQLPGAPHLCPTGGGIGIDSRGDTLVSVSGHTQDVIRLRAPVPQADTGEIDRADRRLFFPPGEFNLVGQRGIRSGNGVAVFGDQLIVSDSRRLLFWNGLDGLVNGQPADGVVGDEEWREARPTCCDRIKTDAAGRLWVVGSNGRRFIDIYQLPLTARSVPLHTIWTEDAAFPMLGMDSEIEIGGRVFGIAPVGQGDFLWMSDTDNHRVLRIRDPLTNPVVDVILGQYGPDGNTCNRGGFPESPLSEENDKPRANMLCFPGALSIDRLGNLYVSDHSLEVSGNFRLLLFPSELMPSTNEEEALFALDAAKIFEDSAVSGSNLVASGFELGTTIEPRSFDSRWPGLEAAAWEPAFDKENRMVVGFNTYRGPRFVGIYDDPLNRDIMPTGYLHDFMSMPYSAVFDDAGNLYVGDINRGRVLIYWDPFDSATDSTAAQEAGE